MNKYYVSFVTISLLFGGISYLATDNFYIAIGVFLLYLLVSIILLVPRLKKYELVINRFNECFHFVNAFIISLSVRKVVSSSIESVVATMSKPFQSMFTSLKDLEDTDKLNYLSGSYYPFHIYKLFLQVIYLYQEEGGDILKMSKHLLNEARDSENYAVETSGVSKRKSIEIAILWIICLAILVFMRFALKDFFLKIKDQILYISAICVLFAFALLSLYVLVIRATNLKLKGYNPHEKFI